MIETVRSETTPNTQRSMHRAESVVLAAADEKAQEVYEKTPKELVGQIASDLGDIQANLLESEKKEQQFQKFMLDSFDRMNEKLENWLKEIEADKVTAEQLKAEPLGREVEEARARRIRDEGKLEDADPEIVTDSGSKKIKEEFRLEGERLLGFMETRSKKLIEELTEFQTAEDEMSAEIMRSLNDIESHLKR